MKYFRFKGLLQHEAWLAPAFVGVDHDGIIRYLSGEAPEAIGFEAIDGLAIPGFQNAHSHAFQYAMAGLAENHPDNVTDDFWSWREAMYQCAMSVTPDQVEAIAAMLYAEMLRHGYTHVAEFHYLHHDKNGKAYAHLAEMGERHVSAAKSAGIKITLVPVFYQRGGFGRDPESRQRRFISKSPDDYFKLLEASRQVLHHYTGASLGFGVHSLRAVDLADVGRTYSLGPRDLPFHLHAAEQKKEINDCLAQVGSRPVQWLLDNLPVDQRCSIVHATHLDDEEVKRLAASQATVVLCPSTEGNLGDGIFRMKNYVDLGGRWCIGTDSQIGLDPLEEFRMMDYRQRLTTHRRNIFRDDAAHYLVNEEVQRGRLAMGLNFHDHFVPGQPLDAIVYHASTPLLGETSEKNWLSTLVYAAGANTRVGTLVNGRWIIKNDRHAEGEGITRRFAETMRALASR
jgi:formimidoylglutamate deiminase